MSDRQHDLNGKPHYVTSIIPKHVFVLLIISALITASSSHLCQPLLGGFLKTRQFHILLFL